MARRRRSFSGIVRDVIKQANILIEVFDARFVFETQNCYLHEKAMIANRQIIPVINKIDLVKRDFFKENNIDISEYCLISAKKHRGILRLKSEIKRIVKLKKIKNPVVAVLGYPNVGKSSIINRLKHKGSARTSPEPGFTKGVQLLRIDKNIMMLDTPGVIPRGKDDETSLVLVAAKDPNRVEDPEFAVIELIKQNKDVIEDHYGVRFHVNAQRTIEEIAIKLNMIRKGGVADINRVTRKILTQWQSGKINKK